MKVFCENLNTIRSAMLKNKTLIKYGQDYKTAQNISILVVKREYDFIKIL